MEILTLEYSMEDKEWFIPSDNRHILDGTYSRILLTQKHPTLYFRNGEIGGTTHKHKVPKAEAEQ